MTAETSFADRFFSQPQISMTTLYFRFSQWRIRWLREISRLSPLGVKIQSSFRLPCVQHVQYAFVCALLLLVFPKGEDRRYVIFRVEFFRLSFPSSESALSPPHPTNLHTAVRSDLFGLELHHPTFPAHRTAPIACPFPVTLSA